MSDVTVKTHYGGFVIGIIPIKRKTLLLQVDGRDTRSPAEVESIGCSATSQV